MDEAGGLAAFLLTIAAAFGAVGHGKSLPGAGDSHVEQAALFVQTSFVYRAGVGQQPFFHAYNVHLRELQPLGGMHGDEADAALAFNVVLIAGIIQTDASQEIGELVTGQPVLAERYLDVIDGGLAAHLFLLRLAVLGNVFLVAGFVQEILEDIHKRAGAFGEFSAVAGDHFGEGLDAVLRAGGAFVQELNVHQGSPDAFLVVPAPVNGE